VNERLTKTIHAPAVFLAAGIFIVSTVPFVHAKATELASIDFTGFGSRIGDIGGGTKEVLQSAGVEVVVAAGGS
jgi:hypothetical protein